MANAIEEADVVVVCFSMEYHQSSFCELELQNAIRLRKRIIPLKVSDYEPNGYALFFNITITFYNC